MGKEKKRRERAVVTCDFTMLCDVAAKFVYIVWVCVCALCEFRCVWVVGGLAPSR